MYDKSQTVIPNIRLDKFGNGAYNRIMAKKKKKEDLQQGEAVSEPKEVPYEDTLSKEDRKKYLRKKRKLAFADWVDKHWLPTILVLLLFIVMCITLITGLVGA